MSQKKLTARRLSLMIASLGLLVVLGLLIFEMQGRTPPQEIQLSQSRVDVGGDFTLIDQTGAIRTQADFAGRYMLIYFGFTYCPDVCPMGLDIMGAAIEQLTASTPEKAARLQPLFISIDPQRDTPEALAEYLEYFNRNIIGLTGSPAQIDQTIRAYRVYAAKVPNQADQAADSYMMDHSSFFYLMDGSNQFVAHFDHATPAEKIAAALGKLIR